MSDFINSRISLISKSDFRYVGTLKKINSEESTVTLEDVQCYGTEGRKGKPEEEIGASDQIYSRIIFRGSDVKDLRIEQPPPPVESIHDPAIVDISTGDVMPAPGPPPVSASIREAQPPPQRITDWRHGGMPPPGPGGLPMPGGQPFNAFDGGMRYPPQGWMPQHPLPPFGPPVGMAPPPWGSYNPNAPPPFGPPGRQPQPPQQPEQRPSPIGTGAEKGKAPLAPAPVGQPETAPTPPVQSKPSVEEVNATAASLNEQSFAQNRQAPALNEQAFAMNEQAFALNAQVPAIAIVPQNIPTGPRTAQPITPALPLPTGLTHKGTQLGSPTPPVNATDASGAAVAVPMSLQDATQQARDAVARAMATMNQSNGIDNLTKKVDEMKVNASAGNAGDHHRGNRGGAARRGQGGGGGPRPAKIDVPDSDFDFAKSNAKFNKDDLREAIAGSPLGETAGADEGANVAGTTTTDGAKDDAAATPAPAYNKAASFFDNISSESRERSEGGGQRAGGREWRDEEQRRNMATFGQGSIDGGSGGGHRRNYRGRGRGRGGNRYRGGYGGGRGRGGGGANNYGQQAAAAASTQ